MTHMRPIQPPIANPLQERKTKPKPEESFVVAAIGDSSDQSGRGRKPAGEPSRQPQAVAPPLEELAQPGDLPGLDPKIEAEAPADAARRFAARQAADDLAALLDAAVRTSHS